MLQLITALRTVLFMRSAPLLLKLQYETGLLSRLQCEAAVGEAHNLARDAQPDAAAALLGGEEGDEDVVGNVGRDEP